MSIYEVCVHTYARSTLEPVLFGHADYSNNIALPKGAQETSPSRRPVCCHQEKHGRYASLPRCRNKTPQNRKDFVRTS